MIDEDSMKYRVKYEDNNGNDEIVEFNTKEEAEKAIEDDLKCCIKFAQDCNFDCAKFGNKTEFWIIDGDEYASWERLWE